MRERLALGLLILSGILVVVGAVTSLEGGLAALVVGVWGTAIAYMLGVE